MNMLMTNYTKNAYKMNVQKNKELSQNIEFCGK